MPTGNRNSYSNRVTIKTLYIVGGQLNVFCTRKCLSLERNTNILIYTKRRLGMCARKLGKLREATKIFRDLVKEFPMMSVFNIHENLIEVLLALQNYPDVQGVLAKYDGSKEKTVFLIETTTTLSLSLDISLPKSATICYTAALLKARAVATT